MTKTDAAAERLRGAEGVDWAYDGQSDDLATVLDALDKAQATLDVLTRMDELTIEAQTRRAEAAEADRDTMIERAHGWKARAESAEAERDELRMALTEDAAAIDRTTVVVATAVGDSRLAIGREMVKLGYQWLRERLTTAESERDHYKHAALKLGSDLEKAEAERDAAVGDWRAEAHRSEKAESKLARIADLVAYPETVKVHAGGGNLVSRQYMVAIEDIRRAE